jgi:hypothetical protein
MTLRTMLSSLLILALPACGGGAGTSPTPTPTGPQTEAFMGSASVSASGGCSSSTMGHPFQSGEGEVVVTLVQSAGDGGVAVQVCHPTATNHAVECTIPPFARIAVGQTARGALKGGRSQVLTVYPSTCGAPGPPAAATVTYSVNVEHPR